MKRIFLGTGALLLLGIGVFAGRASNKFFGSAATLFFSVGGVCKTTDVLASFSGANKFITSPAGANAATVNTAGGTAINLYATNSCSKPVYIEP